MLRNEFEEPAIKQIQGFVLDLTLGSNVSGRRWTRKIL
jgi:hypothetical protein